MKRIVYFIVASICLLGSTAMAQNVKQKVAVYVTGDVDNGYKKVIGSKLVTGITRSEDYAAVERTADFLAELNKEQDYQMSGAVSDNQIARLGQQFGVRYVLVADVSEIFESIFISARMIDVQTAQITNSTEESAVVHSMDGLTELSENVISALIGSGMRGNSIAKFKIIGPFGTDNIHEFKQQIPVGYRVASKGEIESLIISSRKTHKQLVFPIYADIVITNKPDVYTSPYYFLTASFYENENAGVKEFKGKEYLWRSTSSGTWYREEIPSGYIYLVSSDF